MNHQSPSMPTSISAREQFPSTEVMLKSSGMLDGQQPSRVPRVNSLPSIRKPSLTWDSENGWKLKAFEGRKLHRGIVREILDLFFRLFGGSQRELLSTSRTHRSFKPSRHAEVPSKGRQCEAWSPWCCHWSRPSCSASMTVQLDCRSHRRWFIITDPRSCL